MVQNGLKTETLARLYLKQGYPERAAQIFEKLWAEDPENQTLAKGLSESRVALVAKHGVHDMETRKRLQVLQWILARLTGQPDPDEAQGMAREGEDMVTDPLERRLVILRSMLQRLTHDRV